MQPSSIVLLVGISILSACSDGTAAVPDSATSTSDAPSASESLGEGSDIGTTTGESGSDDGSSTGDPGACCDAGTTDTTGEPSTSETGDTTTGGPVEPDAVVHTARAQLGQLVFAAVDLDTGDETIIDDSVALQPGERLTGMSPMEAGRFVVSSVAAGPSNRLVFLDIDGTAEEIQVSGLSSNGTIENVLALDSTQGIVVISTNGGIPPFFFGTIDFGTGSASIDMEAPPIAFNQRVDDLTRCPDGTIYLTSVAGEGTFQLAEIDLVGGVVETLLPYEILEQSGIGFPRDLDCSAQGELHLLGDDDGDQLETLFLVDTATSVLSPVIDLDVELTAFDTL